MENCLVLMYTSALGEMKVNQEEGKAKQKKVPTLQNLGGRDLQLHIANLLEEIARPLSRLLRLAIFHRSVMVGDGEQEKCPQVFVAECGHLIQPGR